MYNVEGNWGEWMKSKLSLTLPLFFVPIIHQKKKQFVGLLIKKKVFEAIKIKIKKNRLKQSNVATKLN